MMCNETPHQGRDKRKDERTERDREERGKKKERKGKNVAVMEWMKDAWGNERKLGCRRA